MCEGIHGAKMTILTKDDDVKCVASISLWLGEGVAYGKMATVKVSLEMESRSVLQDHTPNVR